MKTRKAIEKKNRILMAAAKVFAQKGYAETTLADIGAEAGTYAGSLYYYFSSKETIVEEVLNIGTTSVSNRVMETVSMLPPEVGVYDRIRIAIETHLTQMLLRDDFVLAYWRLIDQVPLEVRNRHIVLPRAYGQFLQSLVIDGQLSGELRSDLDAKLAVLLLVGSTIYALDWFDPDGSRSAIDIAHLLIEMFFFGMVRRSEADSAKRFVKCTVDASRVASELDMGDVRMDELSAAQVLPLRARKGVGRKAKA